jgi:predicted lactoylglutathione lyase
MMADMARLTEPSAGDHYMANTATANRTFFVTLPVADVEHSREFFSRLGFEFDPAFSVEGSAACMLIDERARVMLGSHETFAQVSHRPMADPATQAIALFSFTVGSRDEVDAIGAAAIAHGGVEADGAEDQGFMYTFSFFDLDGHGWQAMWMNPDA